MAGWRYTRLRTLRVRFLLALALIGVLPLGVVGLGMATLDRRALAEQSAQELTGLARGLAGQLKVYLDDLLSATRAIAALPAITSLDPAQQEPLLKELFQHYPQLARLATFDLSGSPLASAHPTGAPSVAARPSFQTAARRGEQAWDAADALTTGRASLLIHTPIRDVDRRVVGVVGAVVDLENLSVVVGRVPVGGGGRVFVFDGEGRLLMHPEPDAAQEPRDYAWMGVPTGGRLAGPGMVRYQFAGEARVAAYAPVPTIDWTVMVERPEREILAPARRSWHLAIAGLGTSAVLALVTAIVLARMLTRPVHALATAAQALATGDAGVPLSAMTSKVNELRTLVEAFTSMRQAVIQREEALRQSEERFRSLVEHSADAIALLDPAGTIRYTTPAGMRILGYPVEELPGRNIDELIHPDDLPATQDMFRRLLARPGASLTAEVRIRHKNGSWRWIEEVRTNLLAEPSVQAIVVNYRDITEHKQAEEQLQKLLYEKEVLLREIHHRVKNNLTVISSLLALQVGTNSDPEVNALLKDSQQRIRSMALIHEQLYRSHDLGRIDFATYVRELTAHVARSYQVQTEGVTLAMTLEEVWLNLDTAIPCGLILQELLSNCFKHAFPEGRAGEIMIALHTDPQGMYRLRVSDTGVGLPEGLNLRDAKSLGLQLVCILTEQLDGTIALDGKHGTTFTLTFPEAIRSVRS